jgi:hypothetical protein
MPGPEEKSSGPFSCWSHQEKKYQLFPEFFTSWESGSENAVLGAALNAKSQSFGRVP